ncbi:MAG: hypothetical protein IJ262_06020 [Clostridia bacterium]|nr:hypothetical protein [Clostridia bacterium]
MAFILYGFIFVVIFFILFMVFRKRRLANDSEDDDLGYLERLSDEEFDKIFDEIFLVPEENN